MLLLLYIVFPPLKSAKNPRRQRKGICGDFSKLRFKMAAACALAFSAEIYFLILRLERPRLRSNESPSGAFKRQSGLRKQMEGLCPDKLCGALQTLFHG